MKKMSDLYVAFFTALETGFMRFPKTLILLVGIACAVSLYYTARNLGINTDTTEILSQDLPFLQDRARFLKAFPQDDQAVLVVVDADTPEQATRALDYLGGQFKNEQQQIKSVYMPGGGDFYRLRSIPDPNKAYCIPVPREALFSAAWRRCAV